MHLRKRQSSILLILLLSALSLIPFDLGRADALAGKIADAGHLFFYALLGFYFGKGLKPPILTGFVLMLAAGLFELVQPHLGRDGTLDDFVTSGAGAFFGVWVRVKQVRLAQTLVGCGLSILVMIPIYGRLQVLRSQQGEFPNLIVENQKALAALFQASRPSGDNSSVVSFEAGSVVVQPLIGAVWPGVVYHNFQLSWDGFEALELVVSTESPQYLHIRIDDHKKCQEYSDRYNGSFLLDKGDTLIRIPLAEIRSAPVARELDLQRIRNVYLFLRLSKLKAADFRIRSMKLV